MPQQGSGSGPRPVPQVSPMRKEVNEIFDHVQKLSTQVARRAYELFEENGRKVGLDLAHWFQAESELFHPVHVKVSELEDSVVVKAEVPGFAATDIDVRLEPRKLTIAGRRAATREQVHGTSACFERCADQIFCVVDLPTEVNTEKAVATIKDGILKLDLPKLVVAKKVPIETI